jgi:hypothetical protein
MNDKTDLKSSERSALHAVAAAGADGASSPSDRARILAGVISPPGAEDAAAQGIQAGWNAGVAGSRALMDAVIRQHGPSPAAQLNKIKQEIAAKSTYQGEPLREQKFDFKKDKIERQQASQDTGQKSISPTAKTTSQSKSNGNVNSR